MTERERAFLEELGRSARPARSLLTNELQEFVPNIHSLCQISATNLDALTFHIQKKIPFTVIKADYEACVADG